MAGLSKPHGLPLETLALLRQHGDLSLLLRDRVDGTALPDVRPSGLFRFLCDQLAGSHGLGLGGDAVTGCARGKGYAELLIESISPLLVVPSPATLFLVLPGQVDPHDLSGRPLLGPCHDLCHEVCANAVTDKVVHADDDVSTGTELPVSELDALGLPVVTRRVAGRPGELVGAKQGVIADAPHLEREASILTHLLLGALDEQ